MLRLKILTSVIPLLAAAVFARGEIGSAAHPCIAIGDTSVELTSLFWTAGVQIAFTDNPVQATVRVQMTDDPDAADFALVDDGASEAPGACPGNPARRLIAISGQAAGNDPIVYLSTEGPADYRIYVRSRTFSQREAAALIVGARAHPRATAL